MTLSEALDYAEAYMLRGERPRVDLSEVVAVLRESAKAPVPSRAELEADLKTLRGLWWRRSAHR